jgi:hypothetical protein
MPPQETNLGQPQWNKESYYAPHPSCHARIQNQKCTMFVRRGHGIARQADAARLPHLNLAIEFQTIRANLLTLAEALACAEI